MTYLTPPKGDPNRGSQPALKYTPAVKLFDAENTLDLEDLINIFLLDLDTSPAPHYLRNIQYTASTVANNVVSYSALIRYELWENA